jgi:UDP-N-acetylmuramoylalanine--D-glutamate ligase
MATHENKIKPQDITLHEEMLRMRMKAQGDTAHHLEVVAEHQGVSWINHSIATSVDLVWMALRDVPEKVVLIMGGVDRAEDHDKLTSLAAEKVSAVICLGSTPWKYFKAFADVVPMVIQAADLKDAVDNAAILSRNEVKTVLFAPGCPSYDPFDNYKNRGNRFRDTVLAKFK